MILVYSLRNFDTQNISGIAIVQMSRQILDLKERREHDRHMAELIEIIPV